jgi:hypothetical protein
MASLDADNLRSPMVYVGCSLAARQGGFRSNHFDNLKSQEAMIETLFVERSCLDTHWLG